jgi:hypothetical protein
VHQLVNKKNFDIIKMHGLFVKKMEVNYKVCEHWNGPVASNS